MKQRRLSVLFVVMIALLALRWWVPPRGSGPVEVAAAVVRPAVVSVQATGPTQAPADVPALPEDLAMGTRDPDPQEQRNAFSARVPAVPPPPAKALAPPIPKPFVGPPLPPPPAPPPPPPFQVIGSWYDDQGPSVFLAGPRGVVQGRVGDVLIAEYRVMQISSQRVLLKHLPTNRDIPLAVPAGPGSSLLTSSK